MAINYIQIISGYTSVVGEISRVSICGAKCIDVVVLREDIKQVLEIIFIKQRFSIR
jgi:hypothetical protein